MSGDISFNLNPAYSVDGSQESVIAGVVNLKKEGTRLIHYLKEMLTYMTEDEDIEATLDLITLLESMMDMARHLLSLDEQSKMTAEDLMQKMIIPEDSTPEEAEEWVESLKERMDFVQSSGFDRNYIISCADMITTASEPVIDFFIEFNK